ncbi:MAG TPA: DEAD/DEAH box helicase [Vicinamibacterales bacterium]|nr:DEAD/DEAH box helicase [Vicinamibacterales bacterium]
MSRAPNVLLPAGARVELRGERWVVVARTAHADCEALRLAGCGELNRGRARTYLLPFDRVRPLDPGGAIAVRRPRRWLHDVRRLVLDVHPFGGLRTAAAARVELMPFQLEPALATLRYGRLRILIADEVGLGKTIQTALILSELAALHESFRAVVVTPAGLRQQWRRELSVRFSLESTLADAGWLHEASRSLPPDVNPWSLPGIYVASSDLVKRPEVLRALEDVTWDVMVLDEAHGAGPGTARLAAAHALASRSRRVILLTATPPEGEPAHLEALAAIGCLDSADRPAVFRRTRADAGCPARRRTVTMAVRLSAAERRMHRLLEEYTSAVWTEATARSDSRSRLAAVLLRKRALSSARSLALSVRRRLALLAGGSPATEHQLRLPLLDEDPLADAPDDDLLAAAGLADSDRERTLLEQIALAAEHAAGDESKARFLRRLLRRVREPVIVFTEYRDTLRWLSQALDVRDAVLLHGGMTPAERDAAVAAFTSSARLLLATDAASEGLNLQARCRTVVHFELPWMPMRLEQRTGRVDRLGQRLTVHELLLVARHTCERLVLAPLVRRIRTAGSATHGTPLLSLTESSVAALVLEGDAPAPATPSTALEVLSLHRDAAIEADRLRLHRRLRVEAGSHASPSSSPTFVTLAAPPRTALTIVVRLSVELPDGRTVHEQLVPVYADVVSGMTTFGCGTARRLAREVADRHAAAIATAARDAEAACERAVSRAQALFAILAARERMILRELPSAARRLVQAGLFERRAVAAAEERRRTAVALAEDADERITALERMKPRARLRIAAIRLGGRL